MIRDFVKRHKWQLIGILCLYVIVSLWLIFFTDSPQSVPFVYEVF